MPTQARRHLNCAVVYGRGIDDRLLDPRPKSEDNLLTRIDRARESSSGSWRRLRSFKTGAFVLAVSLSVMALSTTAQLQSGVTINFNDVHQRIDGFGAADTWNPTFTDAQADLFFSQTNGIGCRFYASALIPTATIWRPIPTQPRLLRARGDRKAARGLRREPEGQRHRAQRGHLLPAFYDAWATRMVAFATKLQQNAGVPLWGLSVQNEPDYQASYISMLYTNQEMLNFVKVLGPKLAALNPRPKLLMPDVSVWGNAWGFANAVLNDSVAAPYLDVIAVHQYAGISAPQITSKPIWETEQSSFDGFDSSIANGVTVARWIHDAITIGNVSAWHYWWLLRSAGG